MTWDYGPAVAAQIEPPAAEPQMQVIANEHTGSGADITGAIDNVARRDNRYSIRDRIA